MVTEPEQCKELVKYFCSFSLHVALYFYFSEGIARDKDLSRLDCVTSAVPLSLKRFHRTSYFLLVSMPRTSAAAICLELAAWKAILHCLARPCEASYTGSYPKYGGCVL